MNTITLKQRGIFTIPKRLRDSLGLFEGQSFSVCQKGNAILLEPVAQANTSLLAEIREGIEDIRQGRYLKFSTIQDFDTHMKKNHGIDTV